MTHRIDLKILGYESKVKGTKTEVEKYAKKLDNDKVQKELVQMDDGQWELYVKRWNKMMGQRVVNNILGNKPKVDCKSKNMSQEKKDRIKMIMEDWGYTRQEAIEYINENE